MKQKMIMHPLPAGQVVPDPLRSDSERFGAPAVPPRSWFSEPAWMAPGTRLTVTDAGQLFGTVAPREPFAARGAVEPFVPPVSPSKYKRAMQGTVKCDDGTIVRVATLGAKGHAEDPSHYSDPDTPLAVVSVFDRRDGVVIAGSLLPHVTHADVSFLRRSSLSGHWLGSEMIGVALVASPAAALDYTDDVHDVLSAALTRHAAPRARVADAEPAGISETHFMFATLSEHLDKLDDLVVQVAASHFSSDPGAVMGAAKARIAAARADLEWAQIDAQGIPELPD